MFNQMRWETTYQRFWSIFELIGKKFPVHFCAAGNYGGSGEIIADTEALKQLKLQNRQKSVKATAIMSQPSPKKSKKILKKENWNRHAMQNKTRIS